MRKRIYDYDIMEKSINVILHYSFPFWFNDIKIQINVHINRNTIFSDFYYSIVAKDWIIEEITYRLENELKTKQIINEIFNILKNNLFPIKTDFVEFEGKINNNRYYIFLERTQSKYHFFNHRLLIKVIENNNTIFSIVLIFRDNENMDNFNNILKVLKLILKFKNMNIIKKAIKDSIKDIIMEEIENLI